MSLAAQLMAGAAAVILLVVAPLEALLIHRPWVQRLLSIEPAGLEHVRLWSFSVGVRNALAGVGALTGIWLANTGREETSTTVVVVACSYMLLASLSMVLSDLLGYWRPRGGSVKGTLASTVLPAGALLAIAL